ncbi:MAG: zf-HC2 domain-containing protein [Candidatus Marinimicrobia bacterium]|nr:zf-HC2 domain-containing protein [Candidatus Neomarinimicrobiota bacterium]
MSCKKYEKMIFLDDELSEREMARLQHHLRHCTVCKQQFDNVKNTLPVFKQSAKTTLDISKECELLKHTILGALPEQYSSYWLDFIDEGLQLLLKPQAIKIFVSLLVFFFIGHEFYIFNKVTKLEQQVSQLAAENIEMPSEIKIKNQLSKIRLDGRNISIDKLSNYFEKQFNISVDQPTITQLFSTIPELKKIEVKDGFSDKELQLLAKYSDQIIKYYKNLVSKGGFHV